MRRTENLSGGNLRRRHPPQFPRGRVPNSQKHRTISPTVEPSRLRLILERLQGTFYEDGPASERIAAAVLADVKDLEESPPLPH